MLGRIIREGNLVTAVMARYSIIPTHCEHSVYALIDAPLTGSPVVTAIFSVCGMSFWTFLASAILSLPLYLSLVFLGHVTEDQDQREFFGVYRVRWSLKNL